MAMEYQPVAAVAGAMDCEIGQDYKNTVLFSHENSIDSMDDCGPRKEPQMSKILRGSVSGAASTSSMNPREIHKKHTSHKQN